MPNQTLTREQVLAHLRACADVWGTCMVTIITQDQPTLRGVNPRQHASPARIPCCLVWSGYIIMGTDMMTSSWARPGPTCVRMT